MVSIYIYLQLLIFLSLFIFSSSKLNKPCLELVKKKGNFEENVNVVDTLE